VPDDPGKRIASLVPGEPAYLVTADGSRYFVGALLPSGHRVLLIADKTVTVERDGQLTKLTL
jgi:type III secretion protein D